MKRALLLLLGACGLPGGDVLMKQPPKAFITSCAIALESGKEDDDCAGFESCVPPLVSCCAEKTTCVGGKLRVSRDCTGCPTCADEGGCATQTWCIDGHCEPCTTAEKCSACPAGLVPLERNGCATCECGPPSNCSTCTPGDKCSASAYCAASCVGLSCCVQQCTPAGCGFSPEGCSMDCGAVSCAGGCYAGSCTCAGTTWSCTARCSPGAEAFTGRCKL